MERTAHISECGRYRWWLRRRWESGDRKVCWILLNPSTANAEVDDPTIRRCVGYAKDWGFNAILVLNLFPWRATDPRDLAAAKAAGECVYGGDVGNRSLRRAMESTIIVAGWGADPIAAERAGWFRIWLESAKLGAWCLGQTQSGAPKHPLYLPRTCKPQPYIGTCDDWSVIEHARELRDKAHAKKT
jgi:hypothetical protein